MDGGKAWPFCHFWLDRPEVGSESEPENLYGSSWMISVLLSCVCRTASSFWRPASLASSSLIHKLACANSMSAFQWRSLSAEALFSAILTSLVRLSWWLLYVRFLDFTNFLTIHQKNLNQIFIISGVLSDRYECYSKEYSCLANYSHTHACDNYYTKCTYLNLII